MLGHMWWELGRAVQLEEHVTYCYITQDIPIPRSGFTIRCVSGLLWFLAWKKSTWCHHTPTMTKWLSKREHDSWLWNPQCVRFDQLASPAVFIHSSFTCQYLVIAPLITQMLQHRVHGKHTFPIIPVGCDWLMGKEAEVLQQIARAVGWSILQLEGG